MIATDPYACYNTDAADTLYENVYFSVIRVKDIDDYTEEITVHGLGFTADVPLNLKQHHGNSEVYSDAVYNHILYQGGFRIHTDSAITDEKYELL